MNDIISSLIGAVVGGLIAFLIVRVQLKHQKEQQRKNDLKEQQDKEIQSLWQIYLDLKKDVENSGLWESYKNLHKEGSAMGSPTDMYLRSIFPVIAKDVKNLFRYLETKQNELNEIGNHELNLLWERSASILTILENLRIEHRSRTTEIDNNSKLYLTFARNIYQNHLKRLKKSNDVISFSDNSKVQQD